MQTKGLVDREPVERALNVPKSVTTQQVGVCDAGAGKQKKRRGTVPQAPTVFSRGVVHIIL